MSSPQLPPSPGSPIMPRRPAVTLVDVGAALLVTALTMVGTADAVGNAAPGVEGYALLAMAGLPLVWRRRWPTAVFCVSLLAMLVYFLRGHPEGLVWLPATVAIASFTVVYGWRRAAGLVALCAVLANSDVVFGGARDSVFGVETLATVLGLGCAVAVGEWNRNRRAWLEAAEERATLAEAARHQEAARQVSEERLRIAREVHDVVAHALASINVQAGVGEHLGRRNPARSQEILGSIRGASQEALDDLRTTVGRLRTDGERDGEVLPSSPGLTDVSRLVTMACEAGLDVSLDLDGSMVGLPEDVDLAAYRIVQESVTNALKYAGDARVRISLRHRAATVEIVVADDGTGALSDTSRPDEGHGIRGMEERAARLGGSLQAGPVPGGGFRVRARLPARVPA